MSLLDGFIKNEFVTKRIEEAGETQFSCVSAEENVLRRMMKRREDAEDAAAELSGKDFSNLDYGRIFCGIREVLQSEAHIDTITVENALNRLFPKRARQLRELLVTLTKYREYTVDDSHGLADHMKIVKELALRRGMIASFEELMKKMHDPTQDIGETLTAVQETIANAESDKSKWVSIENVLINTYTYLEKRQNGEIKAITTGLKNLDRLIGGFYGGELTVIGARPSVGKSAFGANVALAAAHAGHKVGIVSCEMVDIGFGQRLLSHESFVNGMNLRKGEIDDDSWEKLAEAMNGLGTLPIEFMFDSTYIEDVCQTVTRKALRGEMDMLIVDYLQLMDTRKRFESEHLRVGYISRMLKKLATKCNIPVIALAQVSRETDKSMPSLKHLKDSGSIEQDCDGVLFLHRPETSEDPWIDDRDRPYFSGFAERETVYICIQVAKQRQGAVGRCCIVFDPATMHYIEIDRSA